MPIGDRVDFSQVDDNKDGPNNCDDPRQTPEPTEESCDSPPVLTPVDPSPTATDEPTVTPTDPIPDFPDGLNLAFAQEQCPDPTPGDGDGDPTPPDYDLPKTGTGDSSGMQATFIGPVMVQL